MQRPRRPIVGFESKAAQIAERGWRMWFPARKAELENAHHVNVTDKSEALRCDQPLSSA
eukprot:CAMPEP_0206419518 /NCGR_PEP_ID=MMETSP0324_2-20121206/183_1 /ASSEMBLY_ACC=CAM_ASM_000836 /TAXON_ID=2866 /ORGANISM="Crypthecodinium cohnii, Strain Seligo" /LENGTH=58 /DNA_ID=CAMNT_0053883003 /DNA_START=210 /DNA_END=382 /DNA_ORIENTATION=+